MFTVYIGPAANKNNQSLSNAALWFTMIIMIIISAQLQVRTLNVLATTAQTTWCIHTLQKWLASGDLLFSMTNQIEEDLIICISAWFM